ncbi:hypothetical protein ACA910_000765 [Epithemia clementina (nom. ined.)]
MNFEFTQQEMVEAEEESSSSISKFGIDESNMEPPTEFRQIQCISHGIEGTIQLLFRGQCHHQAWMELVTKQKQDDNFMKLSINRDEQRNFLNKVQEKAEHYVRERQESSTEEEDNTTESEDHVSKAQPA